MGLSADGLFFAGQESADVLWRQIHDSTGNTAANSLQQYLQQQPYPVSPDVVRRLFRKLVSSDYRTVYKGPTWKEVDKDRGQEIEKECFCKNSTCMLSSVASHAHLVCLHMY